MRTSITTAWSKIETAPRHREILLRLSVDGGPVRTVCGQWVLDCFDSENVGGWGERLRMAASEISGYPKGILFREEAVEWAEIPA